MMETSDQQPFPPVDNTGCCLFQEYQANGVVGPLDILTQEEAATCLAQLEALFPLEGNNRFKPHLYLPYINQIVRHPTLIQAVSSILRTNNILCWSSDFNIKKARSKGIYCPHQDATYTGLDPPTKCVTAWIALSPIVSEREGCLEFYKSSHSLGQMKHIEDDSTKQNNLLSRAQYISDKHLHGFVAEPMILRGGQASLHHFHVIHQSGTNESEQDRVGLAIRYMSASARQTGTIRECVTLVQGTKEHDGFDLEPILPLENPTADDVLLGKQAHTDAMQREAANYFASSKTEATATANYK